MRSVWLAHKCCYTVSDTYTCILQGCAGAFADITVCVCVCVGHSVGTDGILMLTLLNQRICCSLVSSSGQCTRFLFAFTTGRRSGSSSNASSTLAAAAAARSAAGGRPAGSATTGVVASAASAAAPKSATACCSDAAICAAALIACGAAPPVSGCVSRSEPSRPAPVPMRKLPRRDDPSPPPALPLPKVSLKPPVRPVPAGLAAGAAAAAALVDGWPVDVPDAAAPADCVAVGAGCGAAGPV